MERNYSVESTVKQVVDWNRKYDIDELREKVAETQDVSEEVVSDVIESLCRSNVLFKFDQNTVVRK